MSLFPAAAIHPPAEEAPAPKRLVIRDDPEATEVARLVNDEGWDQWTASYFVHTGLIPSPVAPPWDAGRVAWSTWVRDHVAAVFTPLRRAVGLR